jgi:hypothetical protein
VRELVSVAISLAAGCTLMYGAWSIAERRRSRRFWDNLIAHHNEEAERTDRMARDMLRADWARRYPGTPWPLDDSAREVKP